MMGCGFKTGIVAAVAIIAFASQAIAQSSASKNGHHHQAVSALHRGYSHARAHVGFAEGQRGPAHRGYYADLVGDPHSGLGFYQLPLQYRVGAYRYRLRNGNPPWANPVRQAVAADAARYGYWIPTDPGYRYGVFDPYDGVGTPFFAGYYSGGDREDDDTGPLFGRPLD